MNIPTFSSAKTSCSVVFASTVGSWSFSGTLSVVASAIAIVIGSLQIYDWIKARRASKEKNVQPPQ